MINKFDISDFVDVLTKEKAVKQLIERFKKRREALGYSQKELSKRSGVSYGSIRRFESIGEVSLTSLLKLADAMDCLTDFNTIFSNPVVKNIRDVK